MSYIPPPRRSLLEPEIRQALAEYYKILAFDLLTTNRDLSRFKYATLNMSVHAPVNHYMFEIILFVDKPTYTRTLLRWKFKELPENSKESSVHILSWDLPILGDQERYFMPGLSELCSRSFLEVETLDERLRDDPEPCCKPL